MFKEGITNKIPSDIAPFLVKHVPQNDDELSFWIHECLEKQGLTCYFTREPNHLQTDLSDTCSHMEFMCDAFFDRAGDCIVLGNRASSKTLCFAAMLLIESVLKPGIELAHLGAIEDQAKRCYRYFRKMTDHPLFSHLLARQPTSTRVELVNGSSVEILVGTMSGVNCLHGDMLIDCSRDRQLFPEGVPIRELAGKEFVVPTIDEDTGKQVYRKAKGLYSGKAPCVRVEFMRPKFNTHGQEMESTHLICTPNHPILMADTHKYKQAGNLKPGDRVQVGVQTVLHEPNPKYGTRHRPEYRVNLRQVWKGARSIASEHRLIAEAWFGAEACKGKVVHHIDGDRLNNSTDNLALMDSITHHFEHFGEDSQAFITREAILKMADKHSIKGSLSYLWHDKEWLKEELSLKSVAQIAVEQDVHWATIQKWAKIHDLPYESSDSEYTYTAAMENIQAIKEQNKAKAKREARMKDMSQPAPRHVLQPIIRLNDEKKTPYRDKQWLAEELSTKPATQIAYECLVPTITILSWAKKYDLEYQYSSPEYTEAKIRAKMKEVQAQRQAEYDRQFAALSPEDQAREIAYQQVLDNKTKNRHEALRPRQGAWTVISVELYDDGNEQDVYDISVDCGDGVYGHNFNTQRLVTSNSPHPCVATLDEVELIDWNILQEAFNMARSGRGYRGSTRLTSTRKKASGTMQRLLDEAPQRGFKIYKWNLWDTIQTCPLTENDMGQITDQQELYTYLNGKGEPSSCFVYSSCMNCPMLPACRGQAKTSNAGPNGVVKIEDAIKNYKTLDKEVWDAQVICVKPGRSNLIYSMFEPDYHVVDFTEMLKEKYGEHYEHSFDTDLEVYAGQDAGFGCPATVFLQVIDDPETGEQTVVIFDELYEKNIAPSKYVAEFLLPKHDLYNVVEWFCDPSNSQQLMAEMELQDLYTVPGLKNVDEGIDAVKALFSMGKLLIDKRCKNLIWELGRYEKGPNGKPKKVDDHLCDATRFGVMGVGIYDQTLSEVYK